MKRPAVFFDRDNTLIVSDGYLGDPAKVVLVDGAPEAVARVRAMGFAAVTFSNQSGVARGMFGEEAVHAVNSRLDDLLHEENPAATIDRHEFCPYHPEATVERYRQDSDLRKPRPGMIYQAAQKLDLELSKSWVIGDAPRDIAAGRTAGCRTILLKIPSLPPSSAAEEAADVEADFTASTLADAINFIERRGRLADVAGTSQSDAVATVTTPSEGVSVSAPPNEPSSASAVSVATEPATGEANPETGPDAEQPSGTWGDRMRAARAQRMAPTSTAGEPGGVAVAESTPAAPRARLESPAPDSATPPAPAETALISQEKPEMVSSSEPARAARPAASEQTEPAAGQSNLSRLEHLIEQLVDEMRREREQGPSDFSVSKLIAGVLQVLTIALFAYAYVVCFVFGRTDNATLQSVLLFAISLQTLTISLLIMGRQK